METSIRIVTDSASDLPDDVLETTGIRVVPLKIRFGEEEFVDGVELSNVEFWQRIATSSTFPSTAAPAPGDFEEVFRQAANDGCRSIVCINLSSKLSATYQAAMTAAQFVRDVVDVRVIDSQMCAVALGTLCREAANVAADGGDVDAVVRAVEQLRERMRLFAALDTLENLRKGGRIGAAGAFFGSLLSVKPILQLDDGEVRAESRQRTRTRALEYLVKLVRDSGPVDHVSVAHSGAPDLGRFLDMLAPVAKREDITISHVGPVIGSHAGPRLMAVSFAVAASGNGM